MDWLLSPESFYPLLSLKTLAFIRASYGVLLIGTLLITLPNRRFFLSERWGGYAKSAPDVDWIQNPIMYFLFQLVWFGCAILLVCGYWSVWAALLNLLICRYFFIYMRWKGVARGMGAPGFMFYWMGAAVFLLEFTHAYTPKLAGLVLLVLQVDFAFIMLSAGFYKLNAGYAHNNGMELGAANPMWGFWSVWYSRRPPDHWMMQLFNHLAWSLEILAAIFMLIAPLRFLGGALIFWSFAFLITQIRLGWLAHLVMVSAALFFHPNSIGDKLVAAIMPSALLDAANPVLNVPNALQNVIAGLLWAYLLMIPLAHMGLSYNFYMNKTLPGRLQPYLIRYTNFFGFIVWRVFSQDLVNFYVLIYHQPKDGGNRVLISRYGWRGGAFLNRYNHVCESITVTSLFTTLKYFPSNDALFQERVLRYARTLPCPSGHELVFEYFSLQRKSDGSGVDHVLVSEFYADLQSETVTEHSIDPRFSTKAPIAASPIRESVAPGSYAPAPKQL